MTHTAWPNAAWIVLDRRKPTRASRPSDGVRKLQAERRRVHRSARGEVVLRAQRVRRDHSRRRRSASRVVGRGQERAAAGQRVAAAGQREREASERCRPKHLAARQRRPRAPSPRSRAPPVIAPPPRPAGPRATTTFLHGLSRQVRQHGRIGQRQPLELLRGGVGRDREPAADLAVDLHRHDDALGARRRLVAPPASAPRPARRCGRRPPTAPRRCAAQTARPGRSAPRPPRAPPPRPAASARPAARR